MSQEANDGMEQVPPRSEEETFVSEIVVESEPPLVDPHTLGLELPAAESDRLPPLTLVRIPEGIDDRTVRTTLLAEHGLEIGGGLGDFKGKAWRIGLMGASATPRHVELCLGALEEALRCAAAERHHPS